MKAYLFKINAVNTFKMVLETFSLAEVSKKKVYKKVIMI